MAEIDDLLKEYDKKPGATVDASDIDHLLKLYPDTAPASTTPSEPVAPATPAPTTGRSLIQAMMTPGSQYYPGLTHDEATAFNAGNQNSLRSIGITANRLTGDQFGMLPGQMAARDAYTQQYGESGPAQLGGMAGSTLATLPIMGVANPLIARGVGYGLDALGSVAPGLSSALSGVARFVGGASGAPTAAGTGSIPLQIASRGTGGALGGAEAAAINSGQSNEPLTSQMRTGAEVGGLIGAATPAVGRAVNAVTGASSSVDPEMANLAQIARDNYGINLKAPQLGLNPTLAYAKSTLGFVPGSGIASSDAATQRQWQQAVSKEMGEPSDKIFGATVDRALKRAGGVMNDIGARTNLDFNANPSAINDLAQIEAEAAQPISGLDKTQINQVNAHINKIQDVAAANGGVIPGDTYLKLIRKGDALDQLQNHGSPTVASFGDRIRNVLDDVMQASAAPGDVDALRQARYQYKVAKTIQPLTARADSTSGPQPTAGDISPVALRAEMLKNAHFGPNVALADWGQTPLWDLAKIGQRMREPPQSGTAPREAIQNALTSLGRFGVAAGMGGAGYGASLAAENPYAIPAAIGSLGLGLTAGRAASSAMNSQALANRMINSSINPLMYAPDTNIQQFGPAMGAVLAGPRAKSLTQ